MPRLLVFMDNCMIKYGCRFQFMLSAQGGPWYVQDSLYPSPHLVPYSLLNMPVAVHSREMYTCNQLLEDLPLFQAQHTCRDPGRGPHLSAAMITC